MKNALRISFFGLILALTVIPASASDGHIVIGGRDGKTSETKNESTESVDGHIVIGGRTSSKQYSEYSLETIYFWTMINMEKIFRM